MGSPIPSPETGEAPPLRLQPCGHLRTQGHEFRPDAAEVTRLKLEIQQLSARADPIHIAPCAVTIQAGDAPHAVPLAERLSTRPLPRGR